MKAYEGTSRLAELDRLEQERKARARLHAAANDLLVACQIALRALGTEGGHEPNPDHARETLRAAIAKAVQP